MEEYPLEEMFQMDTKKEMVTTAGLLGIRINSGKRKAEIAERMAEAILIFPQLLLEKLPLQEVLKLQQMVYAKDHAVPGNPSFIMDCLEQIGLTDSRYNGKQTLDFIYPDLAKALLPVIDKFAEKARANENKYRREQLILGLLNLYGILSFREIEELSSDYDPGLKIPGLYHAIKGSYLLKSRGATIDRKFYLTSPYMTDPDYIWEEIRSRGSISRAGFTEEQILDAGIWGAPKPPVTAATGPFRRELYEMQKTEPATDWLLGEYWMLLNNDYDHVSLFQKVLDEKPHTLESVNALMSRFNDWSNDVPRWILKGNSSRHIFETHEKLTRISISLPVSWHATSWKT